MRQRPDKLTLGVTPSDPLARLRFRLREFLWGFFLYEFWKELQEQKRKYEDALNIIIVGEFIGIPLMNSTLTLRLLPYLLPDLRQWKERQMTEVEILEHPPEIH